MSEQTSTASEIEPIPEWLRDDAIVCNRLVIREHLGSGTIGRAFLCLDRDSGETVVAKVSKALPVGSNLVFEEYQALRATRSASLPVPIGYFLHAREDGGWPVLVVDFVDGEPLATWASGATIRARIGALAELAAALDVLASSGRHGDLWGGNVMVARNGRVRLIDPDGGSLGRSSRTLGLPMRDVAGFCDLLRTLVPTPDDKALAPLLKSLEAGRALDFAGASVHLRALLAHPLRSEIVGAVDKWASAVSGNRESRQAQYRRIRDVRETEIAALFDRTEGLMTVLRCTPPPLQVAPLVDLYQSELGADAAPQGVLHHRIRTYTAPDGEELYLGLEGARDFYKPWPFPDKEGLVSKGSVSVSINQTPIYTDALELWLQNDKPRFLVNEGNRYVEFDYARLERVAKVLVGVAFPGIVAPLHFNEGVGMTTLSLLQRYRPFVENLGLENSLESLPKNWLHVTLAHKPWRDATGAELGSLLPTIFEVPVPTRRTLVKQVGDTICSRAPGLLTSIYRLDVTALDHVNRTVSVLVEGRAVPNRGDFSWTFEFDFPKSRFG